MVLKMSKDKSLIMTVPSVTYEGEHNAETIKIIVPKLINDNDISGCLVWLNFINSDNFGKKIDVTEFLQDYSDRYYSFEIPMDNIFTYKAGNIKMWLKILREDGEIIIKTNEITKVIMPHIEVEDTHVHSMTYVPGQDATCIKDGFAGYYVCSTCKKMYSTSDGSNEITAPMVIPATGVHNYVDGICTSCGAEKHTHTYNAVVTPPTCTTDGYTTYTCSCGDSYVGDEVDALGHTEGEAVEENRVEATLNTAGSYESVVYCSVCGTELSRNTVVIPQLTGAVTEVNGFKYATLEEAIATAKAGDTVTLLADVTLEKGITLDEITLDGNYKTLTVTGEGNYAADAGTAAIYSSKGLTVKNLTVDGGSRGIYVSSKYASLAQDMVLENVTVLNSCRALNASDYSTDARTPKLIVIGGEFAGKISWSAQIEATFTGTTFSTNNSVKGNVIDLRGVATFDSCTFAEGYTLSAEDLEGGEVIKVVNTTVAAPERYKWVDGVLTACHTYEKVVTQPTCTTAGYTTYTCTVCGDSYTEEIAATGVHIDDNNDGVCDYCGEAINLVYNSDFEGGVGGWKTSIGGFPTRDATFGHNSSGSLKATGNTTVQTVDTIPVEAGKKYEISAYFYTDNENTIPAFEYHKFDSTGTQKGGGFVVAFDTAPTGDWTKLSGILEIPADIVAIRLSIPTNSTTGTVWMDDVSLTVHKHSMTYFEGRGATCNSDGYQGYYKCFGCNKMFSDAEGTVAIDAPVTIPATGHTWVNATCITPKTCSVCGAIEGEATGHNYNAVVTPPTCAEAGYTTYTCSCGDSYVDDEVAATGVHVDDNNDGVCDNCGEVINLVYNPSFDSGVGGWQRPDNGYHTYDATIGHNNNGSLKAANTAIQTAKANLIPVEAGKKYEFSAYFYTDDPEAKVGVDFYGLKLDGSSAKNVPNVVSKTTLNKGNWAKLSGIGTIPEGVEAIRLSITINRTSGTVWMDDVNLVMVHEHSYEAY